MTTTLYMLDTSMVSYIVKGQSQAARSKILNLKENEVACISVITDAEIQYGLEKRPGATRLREQMGWFLASIQVLPWGRQEAQSHGKLRAKLEAEGKTLENIDLEIAAHALACKAILVTNDQVFQQVVELEGIENWATDLQFTPNKFR